MSFESPDHRLALQTALAASVDLRCYGLTTPRNDNKVSIHLANIGNFRYEWDVDALPWDAVTPLPPGEAHPDQLDQRLVDAINEKVLPPAHEMPERTHPAALAFVYLYMAIAHGSRRYVAEIHATSISPKFRIRPAFNVTVRSTLPVGAGLGSSAAYSACAATAILLHFRRIEIPSLPHPTRAPSEGDPGHLHVSHEGRRAITPATAEEVNRWAYVSEKVLHGTPSGVDNCVAVFGGALAYTKPGFARKSGMDKIQGYVPEKKNFHCNHVLSC